MGNWSHDIPRNSKSLFLEALDIIKSRERPLVLEVGTYAGVSLAAIADYIPQAKCYAIDNWGLSHEELESCSSIAGEPITMERVKQAFLKNTATRDVTLIEGDSNKEMHRLVQNGTRFDFVYVDGSHTTADTAADLALAWAILKPDGVLAIDDYDWCPSHTTDHPKPGIDSFLRRMRGEYDVISAGYRIFLQKRILTASNSQKMETTRRIVSGSELHPLKIQEGLSKDRRRAGLERELEEFKDADSDSFAYFLFFGEMIQIPLDKVSAFRTKFAHCLDDNKLHFDNLINICIMVKDAGEGFRRVLRENSPFADRWTILDTGSTDGTQQIVQEELSGQWYELFEEPFINFRDSRNRLLELAGDKCHFNVMLDDTYVLHGNLREFLDLARGDDVADSFSLTIDGGDTLYNSNRITKPSRGLKYEHIIHETIEKNLAVQVPYPDAYIEDVPSAYMSKRTKERKMQDIKLLIQLQKEDPDNPRTYYYLGDSYLGLKNWDEALHWFKKRTEMGGYDSERQDAMYYTAVLSHQMLNHPWEECHDLYLRCYEMDPRRGDSLYFIGKHYLDQGQKYTAFFYMRKAFDLGMPPIQMSVRCDIYNLHLPRDMLCLCYELGAYKLGELCARRIKKYRPDDDEGDQWLRIFYHINQSITANATLPSHTKLDYYPDRPLVVFASPGGWSSWDGTTLRTQGLGASEHFSIRYAETLVKMGYGVVVFSKTDKSTIYNGVEYKPAEEYAAFLGKYRMLATFINRYPEFVAASCLQGTRTYFVQHDLPAEGIIIPTHPNLKSVLTISEWHQKEFQKLYPPLASRTEVVSYGVDPFPTQRKQKLMFMYVSFANRGLIHLLQMWPCIVGKYPQARLYTFCDLSNEWLLKHYAPMVNQIKKHLERNKNTVFNQGWTKREELRDWWAKAHVTVYPSIFRETCCLSMYEAAASRTLVLTNDLAALQNTCEPNRCLVVPGDASTCEWQRQAIIKLFAALDNTIDTESYIEKNYEWSQSKSFDRLGSIFAQRFLS